MMPSTEVCVPKPIYIDIDHKATLAKRKQTIVNEYKRKNGQKIYYNGLNSSSKNHRRIHSHIDRVDKHQHSLNLPNSNYKIKPDRSFASLRSKSADLQHTKGHKLKIIEHKSLINDEGKPSKSRNRHRQQSMNTN